MYFFQNRGGMMADYFSTLPVSHDEALAWIKDHYTTLKEPLKTPLELPDVGFALDIKSHGPSKTRIVRHIHQMCFMHEMAFKTSNQIKVVYLIEAYLAMVEVKNPLGIYAIARSLLELNAFLYEVQSRLNESLGDDMPWKDRGISFFSAIVRARFGTSDPPQAVLLAGAGVSNKSLKAINVMHAIANLAEHDAFADVRQRYDQLCDFVHHNMSSQTLCNEGTFAGSEARIGEVRAILKKDGPITRYRYPVDVKAQLSQDRTVIGTVRDIAGCVEWLNRCPDSPYTTSELREWTGTDSGMPLQTQDTTRRSAKVNRNDPCPCRSGKKFKNCCLRK